MSKDKERLNMTTVGEGSVLRVPGRGHIDTEARRARVEWIREQTGVPLLTLDRFDGDPTVYSGNIENLVGSVPIPVGLAGPLLFDGDHASGWITAPFATTEGALVASATRGALAVSRSGGVRTLVLDQTMVRAPRFDFHDAKTARSFAVWIEENYAHIVSQTTKVSRHAVLELIEPVQLGRSIDLVFRYRTADAAGQNMTTACTWRACRWIEDRLVESGRFPLRAVYVESNTSGDKKYSQRSQLLGRGTRVLAECHLSADVLIDVLKVTPEQLLRGYNMAVTGAALSASSGPNINVANVIAAIFAATGQDLACIHESGNGILSIEPDSGGVYATMLLPALAIGTVGGGTLLPHQQDYLAMIGCHGGGAVGRLAETIAGFALALDLSTLSAVIGGQFADSHERLGRNRPVRWFTRKELTPEFFRTLDSTFALDVTGVELIDGLTRNSVVGELTTRTATQKLIGVVPADLKVAGATDPVRVVVKSKPLDREIILAARRLASLAGADLARQWDQHSLATDLHGTHLREVEMYRDPGPAATIMPDCLGTLVNESREQYVIVMERIDDHRPHGDSTDSLQDWTIGDLRSALSGIARVHGHWWNRESELAAVPWLGPAASAASVSTAGELWSGLADFVGREYAQPLHRDVAGWIAELADDAHRWWSELERQPRTLVHNDFNSRNIALRRQTGRPDELAAWDWELATVHVAQRDLVELLVYTLRPDVDDNRVLELVEHHRRAVSEVAGAEIDKAVWRRGAELALWDFGLRRLSVYLLVHSEHRLSFIDRVAAVALRLREIFSAAAPATDEAVDPTDHPTVESLVETAGVTESAR